MIPNPASNSANAMPSSTTVTEDTTTDRKTERSERDRRYTPPATSSISAKVTTAIISGETFQTVDSGNEKNASTKGASDRNTD